MALVVLLEEVACRPRHKEVGVCYTRNNVYMEKNVLHVDALRKVILSATSLRRVAPSVQICLFTEMAEAEVHETTGQFSSERVFDAVFADGFGDFEARSRGEAALLAPPTVEGSEAHLRHMKVKSRVGRIINLGRAPYALTLFVDDDTYFCPSPVDKQCERYGCPSPDRPLVRVLRHLYATRKVYDVRATVFARDQAEGVLQNEAKRCVWSRAKTVARTS